jgi:hypothetical protein
MNVSMTPFGFEEKVPERQEETRERNYGDSGGHYITHSTDYLSSDSKHYMKKRGNWQSRTAQHINQQRQHYTAAGAQPAGSGNDEKARMPGPAGKGEEA